MGDNALRCENKFALLQQEAPEDFVIATGVQYSMRDVVNAAANELGMEIRRVTRPMPGRNSDGRHASVSRRSTRKWCARI